MTRNHVKLESMPYKSRCEGRREIRGVFKIISEVLLDDAQNKFILYGFHDRIRVN